MDKGFRVLLDSWLPLQPATDFLGSGHKGEIRGKHGKPWEGFACLPGKFSRVVWSGVLVVVVLVVDNRRHRDHLLGNHKRPTVRVCVCVCVCIPQRHHWTVIGQVETSHTRARGGQLWSSGQFVCY